MTIVTEPSVKKIAEANFPTRWGLFRILGFEGYFLSEGERRREESVALVMGDIVTDPPVLFASPADASRVPLELTSPFGPSS